jgi:hypothetical protein
MKKIIMLLVLVLYSGGVLAVGEFVTGNSLLSKCESDNIFYHQGVCGGYITGVSDASDGKAGSYSYCMPNNVTQGQLVKIVTKWFSWLSFLPSLVDNPMYTPSYPRINGRAYMALFTHKRSHYCA